MSRLPILYCLFFLFVSCKNNKETTQNEVLATNDFAEADFSRLENGDIIVKRGKGMVSQMITKKLNEKIPLSHCGIVVKNKDTVFIVHSVAKELSGIDGVQKIEFNEFIRDCVKGLLFVVRWKDEDTKRNKIVETARHFLQKKIPFDYELNFYNSERINCSELVYWSLLNASGKDLFNKINIEDKQALAFNSLLDSSNFEIIYQY